MVFGPPVPRCTTTSRLSGVVPLGIDVAPASSVGQAASSQVIGGEFPALDLALPSSVDEALALAAMPQSREDSTGAAQSLARALDAAPAGDAGWLLPVDPLLATVREKVD
jgi:hypothetical protein